MGLDKMLYGAKGETRKSAPVNDHKRVSPICVQRGLVFQKDHFCISKSTSAFNLTAQVS